MQGSSKYRLSEKVRMVAVAVMLSNGPEWTVSELARAHRVSTRRMWQVVWEMGKQRLVERSQGVQYGTDEYVIRLSATGERVLKSWRDDGTAEKSMVRFTRKTYPEYYGQGV